MTTIITSNCRDPVNCLLIFDFCVFCSVSLLCPHAPPQSASPPPALHLLISAALFPVFLVLFFPPVSSSHIPSAFPLTCISLPHILSLVLFIFPVFILVLVESSVEFPWSSCCVSPTFCYVCCDLCAMILKSKSSSVDIPACHPLHLGPLSLLQCDTNFTKTI